MCLISMSWKAGLITLVGRNSLHRYPYQFLGSRLESFPLCRLPLFRLGQQ